MDSDLRNMETEEVNVEGEQVKVSYRNSFIDSRCVGEDALQTKRRCSSLPPRTKPINEEDYNASSYVEHLFQRSQNLRQWSRSRTESNVMEGASSDESTAAFLTGSHEASSTYDKSRKDTSHGGEAEELACKSWPLSTKGEVAGDGADEDSQQSCYEATRTRRHYKPLRLDRNAVKSDLPCSGQTIAQSSADLSEEHVVQSRAEERRQSSKKSSASTPEASFMQATSQSCPGSRQSSKKSSMSVPEASTRQSMKEHREKQSTDAPEARGHRRRRGSNSKPNDSASNSCLGAYRQSGNQVLAELMSRNVQDTGGRRRTKEHVKEMDSVEERASSSTYSSHSFGACGTGMTQDVSSPKSPMSPMSPMGQQFVSRQMPWGVMDTSSKPTTANQPMASSNTPQGVWYFVPADMEIKVAMFPHMPHS